MISPKQLKLGASILIGAIMALAVLSYLYVSSQYGRGVFDLKICIRNLKTD